MACTHFSPSQRYHPQCRWGHNNFLLNKRLAPMNGDDCIRQLPAKILQKKSTNDACTQTKTQPPIGPGPKPGADIGVCISETKHNRKSRVRTRRRDTDGRLIERAGTRADVNKPRAGSSTALTISGILRRFVDRSGRSGPRSGERNVVRGNSTNTQ